MLAHFRGPDQQLLVYCNLTFNVVKPGDVPDWSFPCHVAELTRTQEGTTHLVYFRQNKTLTSLLRVFICFFFKIKTKTIKYCIKM